MGNLHEKIFRVMIVKMVKIQNRMRHKWRYKKAPGLKDSSKGTNKSVLNNMVTEVKNTLEETNSIITEEENR